MQTRLHYALALIFTGAALATGCGTDDPPAAAASVKSTLPQPGSTYRFHRIDYDSAGAAIPGSDVETEMTFLTTDLSFRGKDSVVAVGDKSSTEVQYFRYDGTEGVSLFLKKMESYGIPGLWVPLPINGHPAVQRIVDTGATVGGGSVAVTLMLNATPAGSEQFRVGTELIDAQRVNIALTVMSHEGGMELLTMTQTVWYAPRVGYFTKEDITIRLAPMLGVGGRLRTHTVRELTYYLLEMQ